MAQLKEIAKVIEQMENHLRTDLLKEDGKVQEKKLWENTYIKHQIDRRKRRYLFSINDHIQAMVYAMLSSGTWERVENGIDKSTGKISPIDAIFSNYEPDILLTCSPEDLTAKIKDIQYATQSTQKQMKGLIQTNITKLKMFEEQYGTIDTYYQELIDKDASFITLVETLSHPDSENKMVEMGEALIAEYLRNVGYDIAKPDRHIRRILGSNRLACSNSETVPAFEAFSIVKEIANELGKPTAEVDYILWSYCARGFGEICTMNNPKCDICVAKYHCNMAETKILS